MSRQGECNGTSCVQCEEHSDNLGQYGDDFSASADVPIVRNGDPV